MSTIEDRLSREDWDPEAGDTLVGEIVEIDANETQYGMYPVLVVKEDDTGTMYTVHCLRGGLLRPVLRARPDVGARVGIRYAGAVDTGYNSAAHRYTVAFEDTETAKPDWDAIAKSQQQRDKERDGNDGGTAFAAAESAWPDADAPSPSDEPPPGDDPDDDDEPEAA